jgi:hypothetical protein
MWNDASTYDDVIDNIPSVGLSRRSGALAVPASGYGCGPIKRHFPCFADRAYIRKQSHSFVKR